jgi:hypothetical protein
MQSLVVIEIDVGSDAMPGLGHGLAAPYSNDLRRKLLEAYAENAVAWFRHCSYRDILTPELL